MKVLRYMGKTLFPYLFGIISMTISIKLFDVVKSLLVKDIFHMFEKNSGTTLADVVISNVTFGFICLVVYIFTSYIYKVSSKIGHKNFKMIVFKKILRLPIKYFDETQSGDLISKFFYDTEQTTDIYSAKLRRFVAPIISIVVYIVPMFFINVPLTFCLILNNVFAVIVNLFFSKKIKTLNSRLSKKNADMTGKINNIISGIEVIKIFGLEKIMIKDYKMLNDEYMYIEEKNAKITSFSESSTTFFDFSASIIFLAVGIIFVSQGFATISELAGIYTLYSVFSSQFMLVCKYFPSLVSCLVSAEKVFRLLDEQEENLADLENNYSLQNIEQKVAVKFEDVDFSYSDRKIFQNLNIDFENGKVTALVGKSGKGKTTIAKMILGFYEPQKGDIYIYGKNAKDIGIKNVRDIVSYVQQEPYIFNVSVMENIRYGKPDASDDEVIIVSKMANVDEFISKRPNGYDTIAGERGKNFSGGERQRIAIARAILKNSPILLLDEATSALDNDNEKIVIESMKNLMVGKTVIVIAHRETTINSAESIFQI